MGGGVERKRNGNGEIRKGRCLQALPAYQRVVIPINGESNNLLELLEVLSDSRITGDVRGSRRLAIFTGGFVLHSK